MSSTDSDLLLQDAPWSEACEAYARRARAEILELVAPKIAAAEEANKYPRELLASLARRGYFRDRWSGPAYGDLGRSSILFYELGRQYAGGLGLGLTLHLECAMSILKGTNAKVGGVHLLEAAMAGDFIGCIALTEPSVGSDLQGIKLTAEQRGDRWVLRGQKKFISLTKTADAAFVLARTGSTPLDLTMFLVPSGEGGYRIEKTLGKLGTRSLETTLLAFDEVSVGAENVLGGVGQGLAWASRAMMFERLAGSALLLGSYETSIELAHGYARNRATRTGTMWDHQALRHRVADLKSDHQVLLHSLRYTAWALQHRKATEREVASLKLAVAERVERGISNSLQLLGGAGYLDEWPIERALRDCRLGRIGGGADEVLRDVVANAPMLQTTYEAWLARQRLV